MILISDSERRRAFSIWLRTGRLPRTSAVNGVEVKSNPWHDPADGRFTFAGSGQNYGQSGSRRFRGGSGGAGGGSGASSHKAWLCGSGSDSNRQRPRPAFTPKAKPPPARPSSPRTSAQRPTSNIRWGGGGFTGGGRGSFGGAGASGDWGIDPPKQQTGSTASASAAKNPQSPLQITRTFQHPAAAKPLRREVRNGYEYQIDETGRTRRVSGTLKLTDKQVRSKTAQAQAGGADRRPTDDGGHYIAARFDGPTEAFNHFAQDANFNRGRYRALEDQWARAKRAGNNVTVKLVPSYDVISKRPAEIDISFTINGHAESVKLANEPKGKHRGK